MPSANSKGIIIRVKHGRANPYTKVANALLDDTELTFRALGVLVYLLSKPDDWTIRLAELVRSHAEGKDAVQGAIRQLKRLGYLEIVERRFRGQYMYVWVVWETRQERKRHHQQPNLYEHILTRVAPGSSPVDDTPLFDAIEDASDRCGKSASAEADMAQSAILAQKTDAEKPVPVKPSPVFPPLLKTDIPRTENQQQQQHVTLSARNGADPPDARAAAAAAAGRSAVVKALTAAGIAEPTRSRLARLDHVTPAIVQRCRQSWRTRPAKGTGALVRDIEAAAAAAAELAAAARARAITATASERQAQQRRHHEREAEADRRRIARAIASIPDDELAARAEAVARDRPALRGLDPQKNPLIQAAIVDALPAAPDHDQAPQRPRLMQPLEPTGLSPPLDPM